MGDNLPFDVFLLAAGFGKRLRPLTANTPKPLIEVGGKALIEWSLENIKRAGLKNVIVNAHYLSDKIEQYFETRPKDELEIEVVVEKPEILDTGGGIKNIIPKLKHDNLLTINSDAFFSKDLDLEKFIRNFLNDKNQPIASMLLRDAPDKKDYGLIGVDSSKKVVSFLGKDYFKHEPEKELMYTGVQILKREVFEFMPEGNNAKFSITTDTYPKMLSAGAYISSYEYQGYFNDIGTPERLAESLKLFSGTK